MSTILFLLAAFIALLDSVDAWDRVGLDFNPVPFALFFIALGLAFGGVVSFIQAHR